MCVCVCVCVCVCLVVCGLETSTLRRPRPDLVSYNTETQIYEYSPPSEFRIYTDPFLGDTDHLGLSGNAPNLCDVRFTHK